MKRANLNIMARGAKGDNQALYCAFYCEDGSINLRHLLQVYLADGIISPVSFADWVANELSNPEHPYNVVAISHPVIYYDQNGYRVPYSYLLDSKHNEAIVWHWEKGIFRGSFAQLANWLTQDQMGQ